MDSIVFPRFLKEKPALWFAQVEATFALNGVELDYEKYNYVITELDYDIICLVEDIVLNRMGEDIVHDRYPQLKKAIIKRLSVKQLEKESIENKKPSEFLLHLRNKADYRVPESAVKRIWLSRLPIHVREILSVDSSNLSNIEMMSEMADKVVQVIPVMPTETLAESSTNTHIQQIESMPISEIIDCLNKITSRIDNIKLQMDVAVDRLNILSTQMDTTNTTYNDKNCSSCSTKDSTANKCRDNAITFQDNSVSNSTKCWYHTNFGVNAIKCISPCTFNNRRSSAKDILNTTSF